jgi:CBS domain-containing protein
MTTARDIMTEGAEFITADDTAQAAAERLRDLDVGALPICDGDQQLIGMITDRDIVVDVLAAGKDPASTRVGDFAQGEAVTVGADDAIEVALATMKDHKVRRLPVIDGTKVVGMVSQADIATNLPEDRVGDLVEAISAAP